MEASAIDLNTIVGRLIAAFRTQLAVSQAELGAPMGYDRSLVARLEVGRNMISVESLHQIECILISRGWLDRHGDLILLANRVGLELNRRGFRILPGRVADRPGVPTLDLPTLDRVVSGVVDAYLGYDPNARTPRPEPEFYWRPQ